MPEPLSVWKYLLWTPALPSTQHRQLWELFKQERSTDRRRLIWRDEGIRKWNLHWCAEGMEREFLQVLWGWLHISWVFCACVDDFCVCVALTCLGFWGLCACVCRRESEKERDSVCVWVFAHMSYGVWFFFFFLVATKSLSANVQLQVARSYCKLKGPVSIASSFITERWDLEAVYQGGHMVKCKPEPIGLFLKLSSFCSDLQV